MYILVGYQNVVSHAEKTDLLDIWWHTQKRESGANIAIQSVSHSEQYGSPQNTEKSQHADIKLIRYIYIYFTWHKEIK